VRKFVITAITFHMTTDLDPIIRPYHIQKIWNVPKIAAILGFMPTIDRRLSMATKSGRAAKVVPNPATKPTI
jgi:hypothetical protein